MIWMTVRFSFEAAHERPEGPKRCRNLHGHGYKLFVTLGAGGEDPLEPEEVRRIVEANVLHTLHNRNLNEILPNVSLEGVTRWIWERLAGKIPFLWEIKLFETPDVCVTYRRESQSAALPADLTRSAPTIPSAPGG
ncbi:MAG: 6-carboxytetrahydropterin synthase [Deltaproteobacteria bacterium]|nr:MAG: 6-carboxytetrahydropterin synthase [Deltaproteobacteria bacterium]